MAVGCILGSWAQDNFWDNFQILVMRASPTWQLAPSKCVRQGGKTDVSTFCNLIIVVATHHFCLVLFQFSSVQLLSRVWLFATPRTTARQASLSITDSHSLPKLMSIKSVMPSSHLILCHPLLLLPPIPPSIRVFSNESTPHMRWPKYWSFSFSISPSNEHPGLISFRMDWLDLFAVQGTLKSLLQHHSSKASLFQHSAFFTVQLSHPYMTPGKTIALTRCWQCLCFIVCYVGWS